MMGECGCGELSQYAKIVRLGEYILALELYPGCKNCHEGIGVTLHVFTKEESEAYMLEPQKTLTPNKFGVTQINIPILEINDLIDPDNIKIVIYKNYIDHFGFNLWLEEEGLEWLQAAIRIRRNKEVSHGV